MESKLKKARIRKVIERLEEIESSKDIDLILSDKDLKIMETVLGVKPFAQKHSQQQVEKTEVRRISGRGLKNGKKKNKTSSNNKF